MLKSTLTADETKLLRIRLNEIAETAKNLFVKSIAPVYLISHAERCFHIGTCFFVHLNSVHYICTAAHIIDEVENGCLFAGISGRLVPLNLEFAVTQKTDKGRSADKYDLAVAEIPDARFNDFSERQFLREGQICFSNSVGKGHLITVLGFPNSKNQIDPRTPFNLQPQIMPYNGIVQHNDKFNASLPENGKNHLAVDYKKYSVDDNFKKVSSIEPRGLSGGLMIDAGRVSPGVYRGLEAPIPRLSAMLIERDITFPLLFGTSMNSFLALMQGLKGRSSFSE